MKTCPHCKKKNSKKTGSFYKKSTRTYILRYLCKACKKSFSTQTLAATFMQKRPDLNAAIYQLLCSGVSMRHIARILGCKFQTVYKKMLWLSDLAEAHHKLKRFEVAEVQFDEMLTIEHTKLKPLSIALAVSEKYEILGCFVGRVPATGRVAGISRVKYGPRTDESLQCVEKLLVQAKNQIQSEFYEIKSDRKASYLPIVKRIFSEKWVYTQFMSRGNKEKRREAKYTNLEKKIHDPLFALNQRCAKLRDHIKRLARRSWCTTKLPRNLERHLGIYIAFNNGYKIL